MSRRQITAATTGRLDRILANSSPDYSRTNWQRLIKQGRVKVGRTNVTDPAAKVRAQAKITADLPELTPPAQPVPIIYKDQSVIAFDKPAGLLTHAKGQLAAEWTLADEARPFVEFEDDNRAGIVHRLDRLTSGVIILARTVAVKQRMQRLFASRRVSKSYVALVGGHLGQAELVIDLPIGRHTGQPAKFAIRPDGKAAVTGVKLIKAYSAASLIRLRPQTGRTHQLRVHLTRIGHPIIGDPLYGGAKASRLMLHAERLKFSLGGRDYDLKSPIPADFSVELNRWT